MYDTIRAAWLHTAKDLQRTAKDPQRSITQDHRGSAIPQSNHKGPQRSITHRTTEDRQYRKGPTKDCKRTLWAKLQEIGTTWTQWCLIFQCTPRFSKTRSLQCLFCACLVVTSRWFALSKFVTYELSVSGQIDHFSLTNCLIEPEDKYVMSSIC